MNFHVKGGLIGLHVLVEKKLEKREGIDLLFFTLSGSGLQTKQIASVPPKVIKERRKLRVEWGGGGALRLPAEQVFLAKTEE